ncbi:hypothetical protein POPTR_005G108666v4 [Populus trichocarpa]|uniref:Uncharacterized protein n=1 Tax=Populus trichocarpa TaxID=3694 RepID=A0ACC0SZ29_POPTR|nr:hypothetical protein POPTR_005G108666v4 [Populus trichocarpa]
MVSYGSAQTSTSGILVEDVLHLATEDGAHENLLKTTSHLVVDRFRLVHFWTLLLPWSIWAGHGEDFCS